MVCLYKPSAWKSKNLHLRDCEQQTIRQLWQTNAYKIDCHWHSYPSQGDDPTALCNCWTHFDQTVTLYWFKDHFVIINKLTASQFSFQHWEEPEVARGNIWTIWRLHKYLDTKFPAKVTCKVSLRGRALSWCKMNFSKLRDASTEHVHVISTELSHNILN